MKKVMVFNFQTMQYEQASEAEAEEVLGLIESMNAECAAQPSVQPTPPLALVCTCETHTIYHASDCPCVNSAGG